MFTFIVIINYTLKAMKESISISKPFQRKRDILCQQSSKNASNDRPGPEMEAVGYHSCFNIISRIFYKESCKK